MTFRVGQRVVCIRNGASRFTGARRRRLQVGAVYTVKKYWVSECGNPACLLNEIAPAGDHIAFDATRFRPAVEPKQEVSFTTGADPESERYDNRRPVVEPMPVDGWRVGV